MHCKILIYIKIDIDNITTDFFLPLVLNYELFSVKRMDSEMAKLFFCFCFGQNTV